MSWHYVEYMHTYKLHKYMKLYIYTCRSYLIKHYKLLLFRIMMLVITVVFVTHAHPPTHSYAHNYACTLFWYMYVRNVN